LKCVRPDKKLRFGSLPTYLHLCLWKNRSFLSSRTLQNMKSVHGYDDDGIAIFGIWFGYLFERLIQGPYLGSSFLLPVRKRWLLQYKHLNMFTLSLTVGAPKKYFYFYRRVEMSSSTYSQTDLKCH
jgi:hypothetical protein